MKLSLTPYCLTMIVILFSCSQEDKMQENKGESNEKLNFIFILADDIGQTQLGCYGGPYDTPNLDRFSQQSIQFTQAYASAAVCSPTRAALMTGKYPARLHLTDFIKGDDFPDSLLRQPQWQKFLPLEERTIGEAFKDLGYKTALFGKWHLSIDKKPPKSAPYNPDKQGFDEFMVTYKPNRKTNPEDDPHNVEAITNRAIQFLEANQDSNFFLMLSHNAIHDPIMESKERVQKYEHLEKLAERKIDPRLAAMVKRLDEGTGKLLQKVNELGLAQNTVVVFYGDNGGKDAYAQQTPFRKGKGWLYEGGIRVPLLVRIPEISAKESDFMVSSIDFYPTLLELAGGEVTHKIDGQSFLGVIKGETERESPKQFWHYPHYHRGSKMKPASAMRMGKYKLIEWHEPLLLSNEENAYELYDLEQDIGEQVNLKSELPDVLNEMKMTLNKWKKEVNAQMPFLAVE